jgi:hypothetical protein
MGFLDNSGDIILDAVLTDAGRYRLAQGDGTFNIVKFALADDEINYGLYNKNHPSGSAYYDLDILQSPVFEAFTNNMSSMKNFLVSYSSTNLLYLPVMKILNISSGDCFPTTGPLKDNSNTILSTTSGTLHVACDDTTVSRLLGTDATPSTTTITNTNFLNGSIPLNGYCLRIDQGLDTTELSKYTTIDPQLKETSFILEVDNRLCSVVDVNGTQGVLSFIDDDNKATYLVNINFSYVIGTPTSTDTSAPNNIIAGPQGQGLIFKLQASTELQSSTYLFTKLGGTTSTVDGVTALGSNTFYYIDSYVNVIGATTGTRLTVPVRFIKQAAS